MQVNHLSESFIIFRGKNLAVTKKLSLKGKDITDIGEIKGLSSLVQLEELDLSKNQISEIKGLEVLINLKHLNLSKNRIGEIKGLASLTNLQQLNLSNNQLKEVKRLEKNRALTKVILDHNEISEVQGLDKIPNLVELNLSHNLIRDVDWVFDLPLDKSKPLQLLDISFNAITDVKEMYLRRLPIVKLKMNKMQIHAKKIPRTSHREGGNVREFQVLGESHEFTLEDSYEGDISQVISELPSIWPATTFVAPLQLTHRGTDFVIYSQERSKVPAFIVKLESTSEKKYSFWTHYRNDDLFSKFSITRNFAQALVFNDPERKISMDRFIRAMNTFTTTLALVPQDREDFLQIGLAAIRGYIFQEQGFIGMVNNTISDWILYGTIHKELKKLKKEFKTYKNVIEILLKFIEEDELPFFERTYYLKEISFIRKSQLPNAMLNILRVGGIIVLVLLKLQEEKKARKYLTVLESAIEALREWRQKSLRSSKYDNRQGIEEIVTMASWFTYVSERVQLNKMDKNQDLRALLKEVRELDSRVAKAKESGELEIAAKLCESAIEILNSARRNAKKSEPALISSIDETLEDLKWRARNIKHEMKSSRNKA